MIWLGGLQHGSHVGYRLRKGKATITRSGRLVHFYTSSCVSWNVPDRRFDS